MSTILIGVDDSTRSEDAVVFGGLLGSACGCRVVVASAFPYDDTPDRGTNRAYRDALSDEAHRTALRMSGLLTGIPADRVDTVAVATRSSSAHALHDLAESEHAALAIVGSTHSGHLGRVLGTTAARLLHGAPCPVAVVPDGYRAREPRIRRIGVAYNGTRESRAALAGAIGVARAVGAELELIGVVSPDVYGAPNVMEGPSTAEVRAQRARHAREEFDGLVDGLPVGLKGESVQLTGDPADLLTARSEHLDLLVMGSRGYGPMHSVLAGSVSGVVAREAHCPVIVVPRGVEAPLLELFATVTAA